MEFCEKQQKTIEYLKDTLKKQNYKIAYQEKIIGCLQNFVSNNLRNGTIFYL